MASATVQTSLGAPHPECSPRVSAPVSNTVADGKMPNRSSPQKLDIENLQKANQAVEKLIFLAEKRQSERTIFQRASDWILRIKQPEKTGLETAKKDLQQAKTHLESAKQSCDSKELEKAKQFERDASLKIQGYYDKYSKYQTESLDRGEDLYFKVGIGDWVASAIFVGAAFGVGAVLGGAGLGSAGIRINALVGALDLHGLAASVLHRLTHPVDQVPSPFDEVKREQVKEAFDILQGKISFNPGHFTIKGELLDDFSSKENLPLDFLRSSIEAFQNLWDVQLDKYGKLAKTEQDPWKQVEKPVMAMRADYMKLYWSFQARLVGLIQGLGGNCEARSLALTSFAMKSALIPPGWKVVAQKFHDHIQTVLYRNVPGEKEKVWDLLTGVITEGEPEAPLYDLKLLAHAYLEGVGVTPPVSEESLLIRDVGWTRKVGSWIAKYTAPPSNSKLKFPSGAGWFSETAPFEKAHDLPDQYGKPLDPKPLDSRKEGEEIFLESAAVISELTDADEKKAAYSALESHRLKFVFISVRNRGYQKLIFPDGETNKRDEYNSLKDNKLRNEFLLNLANQHLANSFAAPGARVYSAIARDYKAIADYSIEELNQAVEFGYDFNKIPGEIFNDIAVPDPHLQFVTSERATNFTKEKLETYLLTHHPMWDQIKKDREQLARRIESNPQELVRFLNDSPRLQRIHLMEILKSFRSSTKEAAVLIADPRKVGIGEFEIISYPTIISEEALSVQEMLRDLSKKVDSKREGEKGDATVDERIQISAECYIDFVMHHLEWNMVGAPVARRKVYKRWDQKVSEQFIKINEDGKYDSAFDLMLVGLLQSRGETSNKDIIEVQKIIDAR